jgi:hypothetical protein
LRDNNADRAKIATNVKERLAEGGDVLVEIMMNGFPDMSLCAPKGVYHQWRKNPPR